MPHRNSSRRFLARLVLFSLAGWALVVLSRGRETETGEVVDVTPHEPAAAPAVTVGRKRRRSAGWSKRRLATSLAFVTLFFAGASLSAIAGDEVVQATSNDSATTDTTDTTTTDVSSTDTSSNTTTDSNSDGSSTDATSTDSSGSDSTSTDSGSDSTGTDTTASDGSSGTGSDGSSGDQSGGQDNSGQSGSGDNTGSDQGGGSGGSSGSGGSGGSGKPDGSTAGNSSGPVLLPPSPVQAAGGGQALDPEASAPGAFATVWLHRTLPDPTPPAKRLAPAFAHDLAAAAKSAGIDWAFMLAVLRAEGRDGRWPAEASQLRQVARQLASLGAGQNKWSAALGYAGRTAFADRVRALTWYNHAVGLHGLVVGLDAEKKSLEARVLADPRLQIYPCGRSDVSSGKVNVRVLVVMEYMANAYNEVTVSSLVCGHRLYARPGVVSAHVYGLAVDLAALGGTPIYGHQQPGGVTEQAVRDILFLPNELRPRQVISLLGLGGPSFALADHYDHIHVGY